MYRILKRICVCLFFFLALSAGGARVRAESGPELHFAITSAVASDPSFSNYRELTNYIAAKLGKKSVFISGLNYSAVDNLFRDGEADIGFLCNAHFARRKAQTSVRAIAAPILEGSEGPKFRVYIIVHKDSRAKSLEDLKGKTVDFADPLSTTSLYGAYLLLSRGETMKSYFGKAIYSGSHEMTVQLVAGKLADAGFIDGHIWEYLQAVRPEFSSKTKVIAMSPEFTLPPVVVAKKVSREVSEKIRSILLAMPEDPLGKKILAKLRIARFVPVTSSDYNDVLVLYNAVKNRL